MHQSHNIPWHIIPAHFKVIYDDRRVTPPKSHITVKDIQDPTLQSSLAHFIRKFKGAIRLFSETERNKYAATFDYPTSGPLFSNELRDKYPEYLNTRNQDISFWISSAKYTLENGASALRYHTSHAEFADVVKVLIHENEMETLLMLAQHPHIPLSDLQHLSWGHHFGWSRSKEEALSAYLFFNISEALGMFENGDYTKLDIYPGLLSQLGRSMDYPAQQVTHREFFKDIGILDAIEGMTWDYQSRQTSARDIKVHTDYDRYHQYIKKVFEVLYRYDVLARECGLEEDSGWKFNWEADIAGTIPFQGVVKVEDVYIEAENRWTSHVHTRPS